MILIKMEQMIQLMLECNHMLMQLAMQHVEEDILLTMELIIRRKDFGSLVIAGCM